MKIEGEIDTTGETDISETSQEMMDGGDGPKYALSPINQQKKEQKHAMENTTKAERMTQSSVRF